MPLVADKESGLTLRQLKSVIHYDPWTGIFTWIAFVNGRVQIGARAGTRRPDGYLRLRLDGQNYLCHRLAWFYVYGRWPEAELDHANHDRSDNRIANLREASREQNTQHARRRKDNKIGFIGVYFHAQTRKFGAQYQTNGKRFHLGLFSTAQEASDAYQRAIAERGEFKYREAS